MKLRWLMPGLIVFTVFVTFYLLHDSAQKETYSIIHGSNHSIYDGNIGALRKSSLINIERNSASVAFASTVTTSNNTSENKIELVNVVETIPQLLTPYVVSVTSDVHGNLGDPIVVLSERVENWLSDRWQAASNMQGSPIPGEHYLHLCLSQKVIIKHVIIDFETAYSNHYKLFGCVTADKCITELATSINRKIVDTSKNHIIHLVEINSEYPISSIKLVISKPSTQWGTSIWRLQLYGYLVA